MEVRTSTDYPVFRRPRVKAGVGFEAATLIWGIGGGSAFAMGFPWGISVLVVTVVVHGIATWFYRFDQKIFDMYAHYSSTPDEFRAGIHSHGENSKSRPIGFGKEVPF